MKTKYYFNTGVNPAINNFKLFSGQIVLNGTVQIPFECENVPKNASFMFACNNPNLAESKRENVIVTKILPGSGLFSQFAYFICN